MKTNEVIFSPNAEKELKSLPKNDQKCVLSTLRRWAKGELDPAIEKIKTQPAFFRMKFRHLRVIFYPLSHERVVVLLVGDRKNVYRKLDSLESKLDAAIRAVG